MQPKSLLIAIAAFAVTATGVHAYGGTKIFEKAGLNEDQITALTTARELKEAGDFVAARDLLVEAGIDEDVLRSVHQAAKAARLEMQAALEAEDYGAFKLAIAGTPLDSSITTEADFKQFVEAHKLKLEGKWPEAKVILDELGIDPQHRMAGLHKGMRMHQGLKDLTGVQRQALLVARQANDKDAVQAILSEAGIEMPERGMRHERTER